MNKKMLIKLCEAANDLDDLGLAKEADSITSIVKRFAARGVHTWDEQSGIPYENYSKNKSVIDHIMRTIHQINQ